MDNKLRSSRKILVGVLIGVIAAVVVACAVMVLASKLMAYGERHAVSGEKEQNDEVTVEVRDEPQVAENKYNPEGFYEINNIRYYYHSGYEGRPGVDVSSYQTDIDWQAVKEAGIEFAMIRAAYRGWTSGALSTDECFTDHIEGALAAGLDVGVYFFSQALTIEEAVEEAEYTLDLIRDYEIACPVVFDWEEVASDTARTNEMDMRMLTACAEAFCRTVEEAGYRGGVYFNQAYGYEQLNLYSLRGYVLWLAEYDTHPSFAYDFQLWQYTNEGSVPGINGDVDLNIMFRKK